MTTTGIKQTTGAPATTNPMKWDTFLLQELNIVSNLELDKIINMTKARGCDRWHY